ncbi:hypothetical protein [Pedobacter sp. NJ-S-72]
MLFFSGSLYLLATREVLQLSWVNIVGPITPLGGLLLVTG